MNDDISVFGDKSNQLYLYPLDKPRNDSIIHTGRVGLYMTKKNVSVNVQAEYVMRNYRSIAEPHKVSKGRHLMSLSLHHEGTSCAEICRLTGMKQNVVKRHQAGYDAGLQNAKDLSVFSGKRISDTLACECLGAIIANRRANPTETSSKSADADMEEEGSEEILVELSEEASDEEDLPALEDSKATVDLNCLIPWMRWKVQHEMQQPGKRKELEFHPFPHSFSNKLFGELLANTKATNKTTKGYCYATKAEIDHMQSTHEVQATDLETVLGKDWWRLSANGSGKVTVSGPVKLSIICSQLEGKLLLSFDTN